MLDASGNLKKFGSVFGLAAYKKGEICRLERFSGF